MKEGHMVRKRETTVKAKIISKNTFISSKERSLHSVYILQTNFITFELEDDSRLVLEVSPIVFSYFIEGDDGILTYKSNSESVTFIDFKRYSR